MIDEIIVIGKIIERNDDGQVQVAYPSTTGIRETAIPANAVARLENLSNGRVALLVQDTSDYSPAITFAGAAAPYHVTDEHIRVVNALEQGEELNDADVDDGPSVLNTRSWDSTFAGEDIDNVQAPTVILLGEEGQAPTSPDEDVWGQGLFAGGRRAKTCDWRFKPVRRPAHVFMGDPKDSGALGPTISAVNNDKGEPSVYHFFNPNYSDSVRPMGAYLGTFGPNYYHEGYEEGFDPVLKKSQENSWKADVTAYGEGKKARLDCDVSQAGHTKQATADRMRRIGSAFSEEVTQPILDNLKNLYRYGFTIHNSLDGSSAYKIQATAMRAECANMQILDVAKKSIISLRHTNGVMENYDWDDIANKIDATIVAAQQELVNVELLKNVNCSEDLLERIMTLAEKKGLITKPQVVRNDAGDVTALNRGYMWKLLGHGWTHPSESWVRVKEEDKGTLFHVYNVLTGAITHKPAHNDGNQKVLKGSTLDFNTMDKRLNETHKLLMEIGAKAISGYGDNIGSDNLNNLKSYTEDKEILQEVPLFSEVLY